MNSDRIPNFTFLFLIFDKSVVVLIVSLLNFNELSERIDISKVTLHKFRRQGKIPYCKVGRTIRYNYKEVIESLKHKD